MTFDEVETKYAPDGFRELDDWHNPKQWAEIIKARGNGTLWTIIEDDGVWWCGSGYHFTNRMRYLIGSVPVLDDVINVIYD